MAFDTVLDEAFRTVGRGIAAARIAEGDDASPSMPDIAPEVAPLTDAQRARMIEALGRPVQRDTDQQASSRSAEGAGRTFPRH